VFFDRGSDRSGAVVDMTPEDTADLVAARSTLTGEHLAAYVRAAGGPRSAGA
jgi:hypothetical protein